mmetsp:Transcript_23682/g.71026  ORF Transcript_23682/g.71026 Transcript_23682/m.71026 type:complete len:231 (+) Transcript_23682:108-800(+)
MMIMMRVLGVLALLRGAAAFLQPSARPLRPAHTQAPARSRAATSLRALGGADVTSLVALGTDADVVTLFNVVTFVPQPLWILMILSGCGVAKPVADAVMRPWAPVVAFSLCHVAIVVVSATQPSGVAPIAEFNEVFDPAGFPFSAAPQAAMQHMMQYVNFVSEEWPHVLIWDLFVGRFIWLDGERRGVFTPHSVLLTNLIGPPGLMLHFLTCALTGKGLPPTEEAAGASR